MGAISPMNARQRMRAPAFFLPDLLDQGAHGGAGDRSALLSGGGADGEPERRGGGVGKVAGVIWGWVSPIARGRRDYGRYLKYAAGSRAGRRRGTVRVVFDLVLCRICSSCLSSGGVPTSHRCSLQQCGAYPASLHVFSPSSAYQGNLAETPTSVCPAWGGSRLRRL